MENQETNDNFKVLLKSWVESSCSSYLWTAVALVSHERFEDEMHKDTCHLLWLSKCFTHCSKPSFSLKDETLRNRLSHCERKTKQGECKTSSCEVEKSINWFLHQNLTSSIIQWVFIQIGDDRYINFQLVGDVKSCEWESIKSKQWLKGKWRLHKWVSYKSLTNFN